MMLATAAREVRAKIQAGLPQPEESVENDNDKICLNVTTGCQHVT